MNRRALSLATAVLLIAIPLLAASPPSPVGQTPPNPRPSAGRGLVIVAPRRFEAELKPLVQHRRRSLPVEVAILETVLAENPGVDDPEKLKRFLYTAWQKRKARLRVAGRRCDGAAGAVHGARPRHPRRLRHGLLSRATCTMPTSPGTTVRSRIGMDARTAFMPSTSAKFTARRTSRTRSISTACITFRPWPSGGGP